MVSPPVRPPTYEPNPLKHDQLLSSLQTSLSLSNPLLLMFQVLEDYSSELQKKFLRFTTGSDRVPVGGTQEMTMKISKMKVMNNDNGPSR